jgi:hypothetical protein
VKQLHWEKFLASKYQLEELIVPELISYQYIKGVLCADIAHLFDNVTISIQ